MPTTTSHSRGHVYPPIEPDRSIKPLAPSVSGIEVTECTFSVWLNARREQRDACRDAKVRARLPAVQADMRARKAAKGAQQ